MIAFDTNLLVYAHRSDSPFHGPAVAALRPVIEGTSPWGIPWPCVHEFIGVVTSGKIYRRPSSLTDALGFLDTLFHAPQVHLFAEGHGYFDKLRDLALAARLSGPRIHAARIAALCLHHGVRELWAADRDFSAFPKLKTRNPLVKV
jgi:toxin-antitoxin system PIN domain toxin